MRRDTVSKKAIYIAVGIREDGSDAEAVSVALNTFCEKWCKSYKKITHGLVESPYLLTFYQKR